jgi:hypothetical protein
VRRAGCFSVKHREMNGLRYNESEILDEYLSFNRQAFMTPLERRAESLAILREKALQLESAEGRERCLAEYNAEVDELVLQLIGNSLDSVRAFQNRVNDRIQTEIAAGRITPNRCPACNRIVKTPKARQCLWCGHDWHENKLSD